ncbi:MBL fold metallo-hydrolase [Patescibacteria group bacterium]|nr:MBL fold metallo-hydrolase [Patescibacteria group bacterium]
MQSVFVLVLIALNAIVWAVPIPKGFTVSFFDVGQGDAIFIQTGDGVEMLVDGGPDSSVLRGLGSRMPFWDREIDAIVATHPDKDHIGGLVDVLKRYDIGAVIESGVEHDTSFTRSFEKGAEGEGAARILARRDMRFILGKNAYADVLYPSSDVSNLKETNAGSIILRVVYGDTEFMLTGDAPLSVEKSLLAIHKEKLASDVLKAGHHGSKTSSVESFVEVVNPQYVVFSRGCDNSYGHPHETVLALFEKLKILALDTCEDGTVTFTSNGKTLRVGAF